jgi:hypothetical protein
VCVWLLSLTVTMGTIAKCNLCIGMNKISRIYRRVFVCVWIEIIIGYCVSFLRFFNFSSTCVLVGGSLCQVVIYVEFVITIFVNIEMQYIMVANFALVFILLVSFTFSDVQNWPYFTAAGWNFHFQNNFLSVKYQ